MISFGYEDTDWRLDHEPDAAQWIALVLRQQGRQDEQVTYVFCSDEHLLYLNQTYLNHDWYTDILTFDYSEEGQTGVVADLFISIDRVRDNAEQFKTSFIDELHRVMVHGALHLAGFDDHTEATKATMRQQEDVALMLRMF